MNQSSEGNLTDEFRTLGRNLLNTLHAAWDRPERKNLQQEIENGLSELMDTLKSEAGNVASSPTGQKVKMEAEDLRQRVQNCRSRYRHPLRAAQGFTNCQCRAEESCHPHGRRSRTGRQRPGEHPSRIVDNRIRVLRPALRTLFSEILTLDIRIIPGML